MANNITLAQQFVPILDEVYQTASLTAKLDGASELVSQGANANELIIPMLSMDGLGDYSRNSGYVDGDVTLTNETVKCNFDRGRMFTVDNMDNQESANIAFGRLAGEFIRTKVAPELDAFRLSCYASKEGISTANANLTTGESIVKALRAAITKMDEDEVPTDSRHLFITPTLHGLIQDMDTTKSREVLSRFASTTEVPQTRFYTKVTLLDGVSDGQKQGGFKKADDGIEINFLVIHAPAVIQFEKHVAPKIITPDQNQQADAYRFGYRNVGIANVYQNKVAGIYSHTKKA